MEVDQSQSDIRRQLRRKRLAELGGGCSLIAIATIIALMPSKSPDIVLGMIACGILGAFAIVLAYRITTILKALDQEDPNMPSEPTP